MKIVGFIVVLAHISLARVSIRKDVISEVGKNSIELDSSITYDYESSNVQSLSKESNFYDTSGILYLFQDPIECIPVPSNLPNNTNKNDRIALVSMKENCGMDVITDQLEMDGANGAILFHQEKTAFELKTDISEAYPKFKSPSFNSKISVSDLKKLKETKVTPEFISSNESDDICPKISPKTKKYNHKYMVLLQKFIKPEPPSSKNSKTCLVCIEDFIVGTKIRNLPCGHTFHVDCIDHWLLNKSSLCPICRVDTRKFLRENSIDSAISNHSIDEIIASQSRDLINANYIRN
ncbi:Receptor homology region, transmembrane domain- and RING domain-containing protein 3 [Smittium mucronatum]|uniref:Receptor homology region, transmembrane domain-and RING domain-containing protein 3 n=1 Tax=Smittium mucronatum TaxID=133383 RepID=A0A1R0GP77_9FUNG|nr:Receptor homology region, transmembrane domain- and RING domain-containing protein 3 [Smittium mucronatum]